MSRKEKSRIDTTGGQSLGGNPFAQADAFGALDKGLLPTAPVAPIASVSAAAATAAKSAGKAGALGRLNVRWEKSGRGGKSVTLLYGEAFDATAEAEMDALLKGLKNRFGCGGTRDEKTLELQGRLVDQVLPVLAQMGYRAVRSGG